MGDGGEWGLGFSNLEAGRLFGIPVRGTHSHAFVTSFMVMSSTSNHIGGGGA